VDAFALADPPTSAAVHAVLRRALGALGALPPPPQQQQQQGHQIQDRSQESQSHPQHPYQPQQQQLQQAQEQHVRQPDLAHWPGLQVEEVQVAVGCAALEAAGLGSLAHWLDVFRVCQVRAVLSVCVCL